MLVSDGQIIRGYADSEHSTLRFGKVCTGREPILLLPTGMILYLKGSMCITSAADLTVPDLVAVLLARLVAYVTMHVVLKWFLTKGVIV